MTRPSHAEPGPGVADEQSAGHRRLTARLATGGLVAVLLGVTAFSVGSAVVTTRAAEVARHGVEASDLYEDADRAIVLEAATTEVARAVPTLSSVRRFDAASRGVVAALAALVALESEAPDEGETGHSQEVRGFQRTHAEYLAVQREVSSGRLAPERAAEAEAGMRVVRRTVEAEADEHREEAVEALAALERTQHRVLVATPVVFGAGLLLLGLFAALLRGHRRQIDTQAIQNRHQALHDSLTGLPNRALLRSRAHAELVADDPQPLALMIIDLDRFKEVNDTLGHHYGDVVLQEVARRLQEVLRASDTVARLGGDEFAIVLPSVAGVEAALDVAGRARAAIEVGIEADGVVLDVDASFGVVLSGEHGTDVETLIRRADIAMYVAKETGQGVCVYDADLDEHSPERLGLLGELRRAIDRGELVLHFQPKVTLPRDEVCGVEALVRWQHPERGLVPPGDFIPLAERTALIRPLTRWVIEAALAQIRRWEETGRSLVVAVNISARNLLDEGFVDEVTGLLEKWGVAASSLELEVTESAIMSDPDRAQRILARFADLGFTISIDDFGAGYTSLAHLKTLPVHQLKIDRSFVSQMAEDRSDALIVRSVVELGRNLGLVTVAEGVEDRATLDQLADLGCDVAQGYYLSRPLPAEALDAWFERARQQATA